MELDIKKLTLDVLEKTKLGDNLSQYLTSLQTVQEAVVVSMNDDSEDWLKAVRCGTVAAFSIVTKVADGTPIKEFTKEDWLDITNKVAQYGVLIDGRDYSRMIFEIYARYVDISVDVLRKKKVSEDLLQPISVLAEEIRTLGEQVSDGFLGEADYTEKCLWILLEAMVKLMIAHSSKVLGEGVFELVQGASLFAFEFTRYALYKQEQAILTLYIQHQYELDDELKEQYDQYVAEFARKQAEFQVLMQDAYSSDFRTRLRSSAEIARLAGVPKDEILDTVEKIDDFFQN